MKVKLWNFLKRNLFNKGALLSLLTLSSTTNAQIYQCKPCPDGLVSNSGATALSGCFDPVKKDGTLIFDPCVTSWTGYLEPGWYRLSMQANNGSYGSGCTGYNSSLKNTCWYTTSGGGCGSCSSYVCNASGGAGGKQSYVFYVSARKPVSYYRYSGNSPLIRIGSGNNTQEFSVYSGGNARSGYAACTNSQSSISYSYGNVGTVNGCFKCSCVSASSGKAGTVSNRFGTLNGSYFTKVADVGSDYKNVTHSYPSNVCTGVVLKKL